VPVYEIYKRDGTPVRVEGPEGATFSELVNLHGRQTTTPTKVDRQAQIDALLRESERLKPITTWTTILERHLKALHQVGSRNVRKWGIRFNISNA
jgi:hypothetical protein